MIDYNELERQAKISGIEKIVVGGVIVDGDKILLLERPRDDFMGGIYELPSGNLEAGEDISTGLQREVLEETGLTIKSVTKYLGHFDYTSGSGKKARQFNFLINVVSTSPITLTEHDSYVWAETGKVGEYAVTKSVQEIIQRYKN